MGNTLVVPMSWIPGWVSATLRSVARPGLAWPDAAEPRPVANWKPANAGFFFFGAVCDLMHGYIQSR
jgi:hypothetical protein